MRWLRLLRGRSDVGNERSGDAVVYRPDADTVGRTNWRVSEDLNLALRIPRGHIRTLVDAAETLNSPAYGHAESVMGLWGPRLWLELDAARLDAGEWYADATGPRGGWAAAVERSDAPDLLLVLASTHADGYLREPAIGRLRRSP